MKKWIFLALSVCVPSLFGQGNSGGLANLRLPLHARESALAGSTVADPSAFPSISLNPALLDYSHELEFSLSHQEWIEDVQSEFLAVILPTSFGVFGLAVSSTSVDGIELRDQPGPAIGTFTSRYGVVSLSGATTFSPSLHAGITLKYLYEKVFVDEAEGWGFDFGIAHKTSIDGLSWGAAILNLGSMSPLRSSSTRLPTRIDAGGSFQSALGEESSLRVNGSILNEFSISTVHASIGLEVEYSSIFSIRAGYQSGYVNRGFSAGIGFVSLPVLLDYSFTPFSYALGSAHLITLGIRFSHES